MSVLGSFSYQLRPFAAEREPGNPGGLWALGGTVQGDVSGGVRSLTHLFQALPSISNSNFYSIEQISIQDTAVEITQAILQVNSMDAIFPNLAGAATNQKFWRVTMVDVSFAGGPQVSCLEWERQRQTPWFLGQASRNPSLAALLVVTVPNSDGERITCTVQGYWWPPGAINDEGGLKRPVGSLFGN